MRSGKHLGFFGKSLLPFVVVLFLFATPFGAQRAPQCGCVIGGQATPPCFSGCPDADNDGLADAWETAGFIDVNCDGIFNESNDVELPRADPNRPDIYVVYDYMDLPGPGGHTHKPAPEAINMVVAAFAGQHIALHVHPGHRRLQHSNVIAFDPGDPACPSGAVNFYDLKAKNFDPRRALAYHYFIFAHSSCSSANSCPANSCSSEPNNSGLAEIIGNDAVVSLGPLELNPGLTKDQVILLQAGGFMHEIGHNLGLGHGGAHDPTVPEVPGKPNYFSVMNPAYQFTGICRSNVPGSTVVDRCGVDYSNVPIPYPFPASLNETALNEAAGISSCSPCTPCPTPPCPACPLTNIAIYVCPGGQFAAGAGCGPIDWNCNGTINPEPVTVDINGDAVLSLLQGFDDWSFIRGRLAFQCSPNFVD